MAIDPASPRTRRALLGAALGASVATVASAFGRPLSTRAADGDVIHVGDTLTATSTTELRSDVPFQEVLRAVSSIGVGLRGVTTSSTAVWGSAANGEGVAGQTDTGRAGLFVALERSGVALETHGRVKFQGVSGIAKIPVGKTSLRISPGVPILAESFVLLTPRSDLGRRRWWVQIDARADTFTIHISSTAITDIRISWLLVG